MSISLLDVWGEGRIVTGHMASGPNGTQQFRGTVTGFREADNVNKYDQLVSNGPCAGGRIPNLFRVDSYDDPAFPIASGTYYHITLMGAPIVPKAAAEICRVLVRPHGRVYLYDVSQVDRLTFETVARPLGVVNVNRNGAPCRVDQLNPPFDQIVLKDDPPRNLVYVYEAYHDEPRTP